MSFDFTLKQSRLDDRQASAVAKVVVNEWLYKFTPGHIPPWLGSLPPVAGNGRRECFSCTLHGLFLLRGLSSGRGMGRVTCHKWPSPTKPQHISHSPSLPFFFLTFGQVPRLSVSFLLGRVQEAEVGSRPDWSVVDETLCVWSATDHLGDTIEGCELHYDQHDQLESDVQCVVHHSHLYCCS